MQNEPLVLDLFLLDKFSLCKITSVTKNLHQQSQCPWHMEIEIHKLITDKLASSFLSVQEWGCCWWTILQLCL